jgi:hypothetical protein
MAYFRERWRTTIRNPQRLPNGFDTSQPIFSIPERLHKGGSMQVLPNAPGLTSLLLKDRVFRIDVATKPGEFSLDNATPHKIDQLMNLGRGEAVKRETLEVVKARFVTEPKAPPFYSVTRGLRESWRIWQPF